MCHCVLLSSLCMLSYWMNVHVYVYCIATGSDDLYGIPINLGVDKFCGCIDV